VRKIPTKDLGVSGVVSWGIKIGKEREVLGFENSKIWRFENWYRRLND